MIDKNRGKPGELTAEISISEAHFEGAIQLVLKQNEVKK
jgi:hypothetical protein